MENAVTDDTSDVKTKEVILVKEQFSEVMFVPSFSYANPSLLRVQEKSIDDFIQGHEYRLRKFIAAQELEEVSVTFPASWWDAVKLRFAPACVLALWPAKEITVELKAKALYPSIALPEQKNHIILTKLVKEKS